MAGIWTQHLHVASGHTYYFNAKTGVSSWVHPAVQAAKEYESSGQPAPSSTQSTAASTAAQGTNNDSSNSSSDAERLKAQIAARLARRKGGVSSTTVRKLGGKKRQRGTPPGASGGAGGDGLQAAYKHAVEKLAEVAPEAAKGTDGRGLVK